jgi:capsular polysaccharide biosynthesis protein
MPMAATQRRALELDDIPVAVPPSPEPDPSLFDHVRRRWKVIALFAAIGTLLAGVVGFFREPTYTSQTRLNVGRITVSYQSVPGFVEGAKSLAASYSRAVNAAPVVQPIARESGLTPAQVDARVDASPVADSPVFIVQATGPSDRDAIDLANTSAQSLVRYVTELNRQNPDAGRLLFRFRQASLKINRLERERGALRARYGNDLPGPAQTRFDAIQAELATARLQQNNLRTLYERSQEGQAVTDTVQILSPATQATSDRMSTFQRLLFVGLMAGFILGLVVVVALRGRASRPTDARP